MKGLIENTSNIKSFDISKALPFNAGSGKINIEIFGVGIQEIEVISTPGHFGGFLRWFTCPVCNKRIGKLYLPLGESAFLCRHCYNLGYRAQYIRAYKKTGYERKIKKPSEERQKEREKLLRELLREFRKTGN